MDGARQIKPNESVGTIEMDSLCLVVNGNHSVGFLINIKQKNQIVTVGICFF